MTQPIDFQKERRPSSLEAKRSDDKPVAFDSVYKSIDFAVATDLFELNGTMQTKIATAHGIVSDDCAVTELLNSGVIEHDGKYYEYQLHTSARLFELKATDPRNLTESQANIKLRSKLAPKAHLNKKRGK